MIDYPAFFETAFGSKANVREFVACLATPEEKCRAKLALFQGARMVWLADRVWDNVAKGRAPLQILFYTIAAEAIAKLVTNFQGEGQSKAHVRKFFEEVCSDAHRDILSNAFANEFGEPFPSRKAIDFLYSVRCDVAHEAKYYMFALPTEDDPTPLVTKVNKQMVEARITRDQLRQIIVDGSVLGAAEMVPKDHKCFSLIDKQRGFA